MPRKADGRGKVRANIEGVLLALDDCDGCIAMVTLRIEQAIRRAGMHGLLFPALDELRRMGHDVSTARAQALSAVERLMKR